MSSLRDGEMYDQSVQTYSRDLYVELLRTI